MLNCVYSMYYIYIFYWLNSLYVNNHLPANNWIHCKCIMSGMLGPFCEINICAVFIIRRLSITIFIAFKRNLS